jgi:hypothetical protein
MVWGRSGRRRKSRTHRVLKAKRRHVLKQIGAIVPADRSQPLDVHALHQLRTSLKSLRHDIRHEKGSKPHAAVAALAELDTSLAKLAAIKADTPGASKQKLLEEGLRALRNAHAHARKAGGDWQL